MPIFSPSFWTEGRKLVVLSSALIILFVIDWWLQSRKDRIVPTLVALEFPKHLTKKEKRFLHWFEGLCILVVGALFATFIMVASWAVFQKSWSWMLAALAALLALVFTAKALHRKVAGLYGNTGWAKSQGIRPETLQWSERVTSDCPADDPRLRKANENLALLRRAQLILVISVFLGVTIGFIWIRFHFQHQFPS